MCHQVQNGSPLICKFHCPHCGGTITNENSGMAYGIMGASRDSHMLTYQTTRKVKCIYFDGESATLFGSGQMNSQMLHIWGNTTGPPRSGTGFGGLWEEYARAVGLCDWLREKELGGPGWGFEGIVRMNAGFEMIWCNFTSPSLRLISHLNVTAPLLPDEDSQEDIYILEESSDLPEAISPGERLVLRNDDFQPTSYYPLPPSPTKTEKATDPTDPPRPPTMGRDQWSREPFLSTQSWLWYASATEHYGSSADGRQVGETRVTPISCGFLSYYGQEYTSQNFARAKEERRSLNLTESGLWNGSDEDESRLDALKALTRRRRSHYLGDVTTREAALMRANSERVLRDLLDSFPQNCSGIGWSVIANDIVQSYAGPLFSFARTLQKYRNLTTNNETFIKDYFADLRGQTHAFLLPFLEYPSDNVNKLIWTRNSPLFNETLSKCQFQHTRLLSPEEGFAIGPEETNIKLSVEAVTSGICSVIVDIGLSMEGIWATKFNIPSSKLSSVQSTLNFDKEISRWTQGVEELMAWLGWAGEWVGCSQKCAWDESCFIPMWPMIPFRGGPGRGRRPGYEYGRAGMPYRGPPGPPAGGRPEINPWQPDESDLWEPKCVKSDYLSRR